MNRQRRVGILGGTFNPIHVAHLILAENAYRDLDLDEIMILPNGNPPHKSIQGLSDANHRIEMLKLVVEDVDYFYLSDMEINRKGRSYTSDTLLELRRDHPDTAYYFILGGDSLFQIETWHEPDIIMKNCVILASVRDGVSLEKTKAQAEYLMDKYSADIRILDLPDLMISSSEIRARVAGGQSVRFMVPEKVNAYIEAHHLYKGEAEI